MTERKDDKIQQEHRLEVQEQRPGAVSPGKIGVQKWDLKLSRENQGGVAQRLLDGKEG